MRVKEEVTLGTLLFLTSYLFPHYFYFSLILIYALASYLRLKYFPAFVSAILLVFSPFRSFLVLLAYPLLFMDRRYAISFLLSTFFALLTKNYLVLLLSFALEKRGLITSGILFVAISFLFTNSLYGDLGYFLLLSGVISAVIEEKTKISLKTSAIVYLSSLALYFKIPYLIPILTSFSPLTSLLFSPFYPFMSLIALKYLEKRIKIIGIIPSIASFFYPPLALSPFSNMTKDNSKLVMLYYIIPFSISLYFFATGHYELSQLFSIFSISLLAIRYSNYVLNIAKKLVRPLVIFYPYIISAFLVFLASYFYFYNLPYLTVTLLAAIVISLPSIKKINPYPLGIALLSLVNPISGISSSLSKISYPFLIIPLVGVLFFHSSLFSWVFYAIGVSLSLARVEKQIRGNVAILAASLLYFAYSIFTFILGEFSAVNLFSSIAIVLGIISLLVKFREKFSVYEVLSYVLSALPIPFLSLPFLYLHKRLGVIALLIEVVLISLLIKYVSYVEVISLHKIAFLYTGSYT